MTDQTSNQPDNTTPSSVQLHVYCLQPDVLWHAPEQNRVRFADLLDQAQPEAGSLIVLPETATTGFTNDVSGMSDTATGETSAWACGLAAEYKCHLLSGVIATDTLTGLGKNDALLVGPAGTEIGRYTKIHRFPLSREPDYFAGGTEVSRFDVGGASVCPLICYDLRFPETWRRGAGADVFALIANWPAQRMHHWHALLRARAIENQAYVIGVNRTGTDPTVQYAGGTVIYDYDGHCIKEMDERPGVMATTLDLAAMRRFRRKLPFLPAARRRDLEPAQR